MPQVPPTASDKRGATSLTTGNFLDNFAITLLIDLLQIICAVNEVFNSIRLRRFCIRLLVC